MTERQPPANLTELPLEPPSPATPGRGDPCNVLWCSNAPWAATGYGKQTGMLARTLPQLGHTMTIFANYGIAGTRLQFSKGVMVLPLGRDQYGNDIMQAHADVSGAEVIVTLYDAWCFSFARLEIHHTPWIAWVPVDHEDVPSAVVDALQHASGVVAMSLHGQAALRRAGIEADYIPLSVNCEIYNPGDQAEARRKLELPEDRFIYGMVGANVTYPSRKGFPQALAAYARVREMYPNTLLYLHTTIDDAKGGLNLRHLCDRLGLVVGEDVIFTDPYDLQTGYPEQALADLYRSFDVLLMPSLGEGFGVPVIEAMACGTPVIATRCTSLIELVEGHGFMVEGDPYYTDQDQFQVIPYVYGLMSQMADAFYARFEAPHLWQARRESVAVHAARYDHNSLVSHLWDDYLRQRTWLEKGKE